jgi:16S rRNA (guanine966-N2)-methyltransferase
MRIISGKHKGRRIEVPREVGNAIRPTSDFAREAIFNMLSHGALAQDYPFVDKSVLDVFCGTGAFGLEALSRGAKRVTFIDQSRDALAGARANAQRMNELDNCDFVQTNATKLANARAPYALVFCDPPYYDKLIPPTLESLRAGGWVNADSLVIIEHDAKEVPELPDTFTVIDQRRYGRAIVQMLVLSTEKSEQN